MMTISRLSLVCLGAWLMLSAKMAQGQNTRPLGAVRVISIGSMGREQDATQLTRELTERLRHNPLLRLAPAAQADAALEGEGATWVRGHDSLSPRSRINDVYSEPVYSGYLSVTLEAKAGEVLWSYFARSKEAGSRSEIYRDLADQVLEALAGAIRRANTATPSALAPGGTRPASLRGGGATFPFPIYQRWFTSFQNAFPAIILTYDPLGSSAGVARFEAGEFDFAGSDVPPSVLKPMRESLAFPTVAGAVVLVYNLPRFSSDLRLTSEVAAAILEGRITKWNDPALRALNPASSLPDRPIRVIHRDDGSGTTYALTHYLSEDVRRWKETIGEGDRITWPTGEGVGGNEGLSALVSNTPYSFGYTEFIYAFRRELGIASVRNAAGRFVQADLASIASAAEAMTQSIPTDFNISLSNAPGRDAYPIATLTWFLIPAHEADAAKRAALKSLLEWALGPGQRQTEQRLRL